MKLIKTLYNSVGILTFASLLLLSLKSQAHSSDFFCQIRQGVPVTIARTERGDIPIIRWVSTNLPKNLTPEKLCQQVSEKFQAAQDNQRLSYITTGQLNGRLAICVSNKVGGGCADVLFTLKVGSDPKRILKQLLNLRGLASGQAIEQGDKQIYINFYEYLRRIPPENF